MREKNDDFSDKKIRIVDSISKANSELILGKSLDINVQIFKVKGNIVTFGIDASKDISIFREEVYKRSQLKNENDKTKN